MVLCELQYCKKKKKSVQNADKDNEKKMTPFMFSFLLVFLQFKQKTYVRQRVQLTDCTISRSGRSCLEVLNSYTSYGKHIKEKKIHNHLFFFGS